MKSNKSNKLKYFRYIICILLIILLIKASYRSYICSLLYEKDAVSIVKQEDTNYFLYNSNDEINNNEIKEKFILLSGNISIGDIKTKDVINLNTSIKTVKLKIIILDKNNNIIENVKIKNDNINIHIKTDTYKIIAVGKWFTGDINIITNK